MKSTKKGTKAKAASKPTRRAAKAKKPAATKAAAKDKPAKAALAKGQRSAPAAAVGKAATAARPPKPVHEWAEAIKKAALQNKQGHNAWPGAGSPSWKGKQRPE
jgi:hypothetical protein